MVPIFKQCFKKSWEKQTKSPRPTVVEYKSIFMKTGPELASNIDVTVLSVACLISQMVRNKNSYAEKLVV